MKNPYNKIIRINSASIDNNNIELCFDECSSVSLQEDTIEKALFEYNNKFKEHIDFIKFCILNANIKSVYIQLLYNSYVYITEEGDCRIAKINGEYNNILEHFKELAIKKSMF